MEIKRKEDELDLMIEDFTARIDAQIKEILGQMEDICAALAKKQAIIDRLKEETL
jgi:hypothetical protein